MTQLSATTRVYEMKDYILRRHSAPQHHRILDLGCGDGARSLTLAARRFTHVTGIDMSENLLAIARNQARRRKLHIDFRRADPRATGLESASFDEVQIMGGLFGQGKSPRADVELLREVQRLLCPGGVLRLRFEDGAWIRENLREETVEALPSGFIYRHRSVTDDGHCLKTESLSADEATGAGPRQTARQWIYTPREVSDLLHRLGFRALVYEISVSPPFRVSRDDVPSHIVRCIVPSAHPQQVMRTG